VTAVSRTARLSAERDAPTDTQRSCMTHDGKSDSAALIKKVALLEHCEIAERIESNHCHCRIPP